MSFQKDYKLITFTLLLIIASAVKSRKIKCVENGRFYRDPDRPPHKIWTPTECSKYYLCLEGEVFDFRCSNGRFFDIKRQICDFKLTVDNCDITTETASPKPLLEKAKCPAKHLGCADGTCFPAEYFCDGSNDCADGSDEAYCNPSIDPNGATSCNPTTCKPPNCFCSHDGTKIPKDLPLNQTPQMVILTLDGAINYENFDVYMEIFKGKLRNPDGCPIKGTFFVNHQNNNYHQTQKLWNQGHEIAVHSVTHRAPQEWWGHNATLEDWFDEMVGQANILHRFSGVRMDEIRGLRVPFLSVGWNRQFLMMKEFGFVYDSSIVAPLSNPPVWPYTLDHKPPHKCTKGQNCPSRAYPGLWELPLNPLEFDDFNCVMLATCPSGLTGDDVYSILVHNFKRHYLTNKAPFGLYFRADWFKKREYVDAFKDFISRILQQPDVWFVTNWQAISWMKEPTPIYKLNLFQPWNCDKFLEKNEIACNVPNVCKLRSRLFQDEKYLYTCFRCPENYPWVRNEFGFE